MLKTIKNFNTNFNAFNAFGRNLKKLISWLKQRKLLTLTLIIFLAVGGRSLYARIRPVPLQEQYQLTTVAPKSLKETVIASGKIESETQVDLKFQTSGLLSWVGVKTGDRVKKWQGIASLDQRELQKNLEKTLRDYSKERNDFEEDLQVTYRDTVITDSLKRILGKNQWDLDKAVLDIELKDIALKYATLSSPIDGLVTHIDVPVPGVNITPATAVFTVADPDHLIFVAKIDEVDIGKLKEGQRAELFLDAYPDDTFTTTVDRIDFSATLDSAGATVYLVEFKLDNSKNRLRLGLNGEVTITIAAKDNILTVPSSSVTQAEVGSSVQVVAGAQLETRMVTTGLEGEEKVEIVSGLQPGDQVVVAKKSKD